MVSLGPYKILNNIINKLCFPYTPKLIKLVKCCSAQTLQISCELLLKHQKGKLLLQYKKHRFLVIFILIFDISFLNTETFDDVDSM